MDDIFHVAFSYFTSVLLSMFLSATATAASYGDLFLSMTMYNSVDGYYLNICISLSMIDFVHRDIKHVFLILL
jgi:hypothetical protein